MATLNFKSIEEIKKLAKESNLKINPQLLAENNSREEYAINEKYRTKFNNAVNFYLRSTVKHSEELDREDTDYSKEFARLLVKYYEEALTETDVLELLMIAKKYNDSIDEYIKENKIDILLESSYFNKIKDKFKEVYESSDFKNDSYILGDDYFDYLTFKYLADSLKLTVEPKNVSTNNNVVINPYELDGQGEISRYYIKKGENEYELVNIATEYNKTIGTIEYKYKDYSKNYSKEFINYTYTYEINFEPDGAFNTLYIYKNNDYTSAEKYLHKKQNILTNADEKLEKSLIKAVADGISQGMYSVYGPNDYLSIISNQLKIIYKVIHSTSTSSAESKLSASNDEIIEANNGAPLAYFNLVNVSVSEEDYNIMKDYFPEATTEVSSNNNNSRLDSNMKTMSIGIIYKELNPAYRELENSDLVELGLSALLQNGFELFGINYIDGVVNPALNASIQTIKNSFIFDDSYYTEILNAIRANPYFARKSSKSDIIQYYEGKVGDYSYGTTKEEKLEIQNILELYKETRDMYYRRLLNKSFVYDDMYDAYEEFYIIGFTIIRFINSKLDHLTDIDYFDKEDVHNFLVSYGLFALDESKTFSKQLEYKKKIIKNFTDLIRWKGSSEVVSKIVSIFTDDGTTANLSKYVLVQETKLDITKDESTNTTSNKYIEDKLKFVKLDYNNDNEMKEVNNKITSSLDYDTFLANDKYWDREIVTADDIKNLNINSEATKYASFDLAVDISSTYIKSAYAISAVKYLYKNLSKNLNSTTDSSLLSTIKFEGNFLDDTATSISLEEMFKLIQYMYVKFLKLATGTKNNAFQVNNATDKYFGINSTANYDKLLEAFGRKNLINKKVFTNGEDSGIPIFNPYVKTEEFTYASGLAGYPEDLKLYKYDTSRYSACGNDFNNLFDEVVFDASNSDGRTSYKELAEYFKYTNYISLLNSADYKKFALPYFLSNFKNQDDYNLCRDIVAASDTNNNKYLDKIYTQLISGLIKFPYDYLNGLKHPEYSRSMYYNKNYMSMVDAIFKTFFIADEPKDAYIDYTNCELGINNNKLEAAIAHINGITDFEEFSTLFLTFLTDCMELLSNEPLLQVSLSISSDLNNMLEFMIAAIKIFISYTSEIYEAKASREYKSKGESVVLYDGVSFTNKSLYVDFMPYNEKLIVTPIPVGGTNNEQN